MSHGGPDLRATEQPLHRVEHPWSLARRSVYVGLVLAAQVGLILAFGERKPVAERQPDRVPELRLAGGNSEWLELDNPTLFALPSPEGFSSAAWQQAIEVGFKPFEWNEPNRWLPLPAARLGSVLSEFMQTNLYANFVFGTKPAPKLNLPRTELPDSALATPSLLRLEGDLLKRRLLYPPELPSWPGTDLLADSIVQVLVDRDGRVISTVLLPPGSGSTEIDDWALNLAKALEFAPLRKDANNRWTQGTLVFDWQTVPLVVTNAATTSP